MELPSNELETPKEVGSPKKRWTAEEDLILFQQFQIHGRKWKKISESLPNRNAKAIRNRYSSPQFANSPIFSSLKKGD